MRCFIAIDIGEDVKIALCNLQQQIRNRIEIKKSDVKWVNPDAMHLTVKFLGEIDDAQAVEVCRVVEDVTCGLSSFVLDIKSVGYFGGSSARVLWVGAAEASDELGELASDIEKGLVLAGWPAKVRKFSGHLTLCRIRNPKAGVKLARLSRDYQNFEVGTVTVDSIAVYQSELTPSGPIYTVLGRYDLQ